MLIEKTKKVIESQVKLRNGFYTRNLVDILIGRANFIDNNTIELTDPNGLKKKYHASAFFIATGSRPYHPKDVDFSHPRIVDSDKLLLIKITHARLLSMAQE